jgi:hypothetical protein
MGREIFRIRIESRREGRFGYALIRIDKPDWLERSLDSFATEDEARNAGTKAIDKHFER